MNYDQVMATLRALIVKAEAGDKRCLDLANRLMVSAADEFLPRPVGFSWAAFEPRPGGGEGSRTVVGKSLSRVGGELVPRYEVVDSWDRSERPQRWLFGAEELEREVERDAANLPRARAAYERAASRRAQEVAEAAVEAKRRSRIDSYLGHLTSSVGPMLAGRTRKTLEKPVRSVPSSLFPTGPVAAVTRWELIERAVDAGWQPSRSEGIEGPGARDWISSESITQTGMDYAAFLRSMGNVEPAVDDPEVLRLFGK